MSGDCTGPGCQWCRDMESALAAMDMESVTTVSIKPPPPGVPVNALAAAQILLDLIAELRGIYEDMGGGWDLKEATNRAEARLWEVGDE